MFQKRLHAFILAGFAIASSAMASEPGERITVTGEIIDTWCYYSGVMGSPDAVVGSAHHTCALWCSAGGIPVGLQAEDGTIYMVLKVDQDDHANGGDTLLAIASHSVTADGMLYQRDGINYLVVANVVEDHGITNLTHDDYGPIPGFAIPEPE